MADLDALLGGGFAEVRDGQQVEPITRPTPTAGAASPETH